MSVLGLGSWVRSRVIGHWVSGSSVGLGVYQRPETRDDQRRKAHRRPETGDRQCQFVAPALNVKVISFDSFSPSVTLWRLRAELLVPGLDRVGAGRHALELERAAVVRHGKVRVIEHADVRATSSCAPRT